ncbi:FAD-binding protein [Streptomyces achromogenes]|uniref:FAD-binding protein n=1 Tax=Streptomyces achromogenes TaxID=67255 RepID=UPI0036FE3310
MPIDRRTLLRAGAGVAALAMTGASQEFAGTRTAGIPPWEALRDHLDGTLVLPYEAGYARARQQYWSEFDSVLPEGVAYCASARDVATCLLFAQDHGLPVAPRSGGHSPAGYSTTAGLVIDVSRLNTIAVNPSTVTVGAGVQQIDALSLLALGGLALTGGSCPTVGVAGFVQGGGYGLLTRSYGMACDRLVSAEAVLTDGRTVHEQWPSSRLLTVAGARQHGLYGEYGNACVDERVNVYLRTGRLPADDPACAAATER